MTDLEGAGRRLARTKVGRGPSPDRLRARAARRRRRRRVVLGVPLLAAVATLAALLATTAGHSGSLTRIATTAPGPGTRRQAPAGAVPGSTPVDHRRLRLWLPAGWIASAGPCRGDHHDVVELPPASVAAGALSCAPELPSALDATVVVADLAPGRAPGGTALLVNGTTVRRVPSSPGSCGLGPCPSPRTTWDVPSLGVSLTFEGLGARAVAATLGPSPLEDLLTTTLPARAPTGWRVVTYDGFRVSVPRAWPIIQPGTTAANEVPDPCGASPFPYPGLAVGPRHRPSCAPSPGGLVALPADGAWVQPDPSAEPLDASLAGDGAGGLVTVGPIRAAVSDGEGDVADIEAEAPDGRRIELELGLGADPAVAEAVLGTLARSGPT